MNRISETTREEREQIVAASIGNTDGLCDSCACGILRMYQPYIDGEMELSEINAAFAAERTQKPAAAASIFTYAVSCDKMNPSPAETTAGDCKEE